jgi:asparagine N-glycosylation enzyme membrane subunit Stt3
MKKRFHSGVPIILPILFALIYLLAVITRSKDEVYSILMGAPPSDPLIFSIVVGGIVLLLLWVWSEWVYYIED